MKRKTSYKECEWEVIMYLETFKLPINQEEKIIQSCESRHKYIDNIYPCGIMSEICLVR